MNYAQLVADVANRCFLGSCEDMSAIPDGVVHCVVTSPPYWGLRDYGVEGQIGLEESLADYLARMVRVFREIRRVLRDDGVVWLNMGDAWNSGTTASRKANASVSHGYWENGGEMGDRRVNAKGLKVKDLIGMPWRLAFALQDDGWVLRSDVVWDKPNPMPESVTDRPTASHEYVFLLAKSNETTFWAHRDGVPGTRRQPDPDYRWQDRANGNEETEYEPHGWKDETYRNPLTGKADKRWRRVNLWRGCDYFYDAFAIREPLQSGPSDLKKMAGGQDRIGGRTIGNEDALYKANESTNIGKKRGVGGGFQNLRKQDQMGARFEGFNDRWRAQMGVEDPMLGQPTLLEDVPEPAPKPPWNTPGKGSRQRVDRDPMHTSEAEAERKASRSDDECSGLVAYARGVTPYNEQLGRPGNGGFDERWHRDNRDAFVAIGRNKRSVWRIATRPYKDAHFATFPEELPAICIRAGSSEWGCCSECGAPWTRVLAQIEDDGESVGFAPSCEHHDAPIVPCLVLDPFGGSGTTFEVAEALGRRFTGYELNPRYHQLIEARTRQAGLFTAARPQEEEATA